MYHVLAQSAARTATFTSDKQTNRNGYRGVVIRLEVTVGGAGETLTVSVEQYSQAVGADTNSAAWEPIATFTATAAAFTGSKVYVVYPGAVETTAMTPVEVQGLPIGYMWRVVVTHSGNQSWTYSVDAMECM